MAADQSLIPKDLRPLHINRTLVEEPRVSLRPAPVFCAPPPFTAAASLGSLVFANSGSVAPVPTTWVPRTAPPPTAVIGGGENISSRSEEVGRGSGGGDQAPSKKVKFLCSFGGKILPRPSDGALRYVGGETRIVSLNRDVGLEELMQKMCEVYGKSVFIKYQLPDEDLDALVSVSGREDLVNMMEEYDKLVVGASSQEGGGASSPRLRIFLFSASELSDSPQLGHFSDLNDGNQRYVEAVNGIPDGGIRRKESAASSTTHSDGHGSSVGEVVDSGVSASHGGGEWPAGPIDFDGNRLVYLGPNSVMPMNLPPILTTDQPQGLLSSSRPDLEPVTLSTTAYLYPEQKHLVDYSQRNSPSSASSQQILYLNPQSLGVSTPLVVGLSPPRPFPPTLQVGVGPSPSLGIGLGLRHNVVGQQYMQPVEPYMDDTTVGTTRVVHLPSDRNYRVIQPQVPPPVEQMVKFEDCYLCKKALPHVHSDTILQDQGGGLVKTISEPNEILQSSNFEESKIPPNPFRVEATGATIGGGVEQQGEGAKLGYHGVGPLPRFGVHIDPTAHLGPAHQLGQFGPSQTPGMQHLENVDHTRQFGFSNVPTPRGQTGFPADRQIPYGVFAPQTSPPAVQDYSGKHPGFSPKEGIMDVPFSNGHVRMEALHLGPPEINEQYRLHVQPNNATFEDLKPENVPVVMESDNRVAEHFPLPSSNANVIVKPGVIRDGTYIKPIEPLVAASVVSSCSHNLQPLEPCQVSPLSGNPGHFPYLKTDVSPTVSNEMWHGNPTFSCINSEFEDIEQTPRKIFIDEALSGVGLSVPFASIIPGMVGGNQETVSSDTLFSSQDPWNRIQQAQQVHVPPPKPIRRVASREALMPKDLIKQSHYGDHNGEPNTATEQEGGIHQPRESSESIQSSKGGSL